MCLLIIFVFVISVPADVDMLDVSRVGVYQVHVHLSVRAFFKLYELLLGCNNGGGGGNFSDVRQLVAKSIGTQKRLFSGFFITRVGS